MLHKNICRSEFIRSRRTLFKATSLLIVVSVLLAPIAHVYGFHPDNDSSLVNNDLLISKNVSSLSDNGVQVNSFDGSLSYSYPVLYPSGVNGFGPSHNLSYSSNSKEEYSILGIHGWNLDIPSIKLINKTGIENLYSDPVYYSSISGELVQVGVSSEYISKNESGDFHSYTLSNGVWTISTKSGDVYTLGSTSASRIVNPNDSSEIYAWYTNEIVDTNGNSIDYSYYKDNESLLIDTIEYGGIYEIDFERVSKNSTSTTHEATFEINQTKAVDRIQVIVDGQDEYYYDLTLTSAVNPNHVLLTQIDMVGGSDQLTTEFTYNDNSLMPFSADQDDDGANGKWDIGNGKWLYEKGASNKWRFVDVNGDGLADFVGDGDVYLNDGEEFVFNLTWSTALIDFIYDDTLSLRFPDINGDGLVDIIYSTDEAYNTGWFSDVYLNNGSGWTYDASFDESLATNSARFAFVDTDGVDDLGWRVIDVNGDGLADLIHDNDLNYPDNTNAVYINDGSEWTLSSDFIIPADNGFALHNAYGFIIDINGDDLPDLVSSYEVNSSWVKRVYVNTGTGWVDHDGFKNSLPAAFVDDPGSSSNFIDHGYRLVDINNDGLADIAWQTDSGSNRLRYYLNLGDSWDTTFTETACCNPGWGQKLQYGATAFVDINGDSLIDILSAHKISSSNKLDSIHIAAGGKPDVLTEVVNQHGGTTKVFYKGSQETVSGSQRNVDLPIALYVVASTTKDNGFGQVIETLYDYDYGEIYFDTADLRDRRFGGFGEFTEEVVGLNKTIVNFHQGNDLDSSSEEESDGEHLIGRMYQTKITNNSDSLYLLNRVNYSTTSLGDGSVFTKTDSVVELAYDGDVDERAKAVSYTYDDTHGSVLSMVEYGEVNGNSDGTYTDSGTDKRTSLYEYATSSDGLVAVTKETLNDNSNTKIQESVYYYDDLTYGSAALGNLTKREDWVTGATFVDTEWDYNSNGLVTTETDPKGNAINYDYDTYNLYLASSTNAEGHSSLYEYDYVFGNLSTTTNPNGELFVTEFDDLGRPITIVGPDPQTGSPVVITEYEYTDTVGAVSTKQINHLDETISNDVYSYFDGFGRIIQERVEAEDSNEYVVRDIVYGDNGLVSKESLPFYDMGSARSSAQTDTDLLSQYTYDALGRVTALTTAVGTSNTSYDQWKETHTDTENNDVSFEYDAYDQISIVTENEGLNSYTTEYDWNPRGDLVTITDAEGNERNIVYDGLSRRTSLEDLHDTSDTSFGTWSFVYDDAGNLTQKTDPESHVVNYTYDDINRILTEDYTGESGTEITYSYDSCTNGIGYICSITDTDMTTSYAYTANGLTESETRLLNSTSYVTSYDYNRQGDQTEVTYPDSSVVKYTYHKGRNVDKIEQKEDGDSFAEIISDLNYGPHGLVEFMEHSNGIETTRTYRADELYRLSNIVSVATSSGTGSGGDAHRTLEAELFELTEAMVTEEAVETVEELVLEERAEERIVTSEIVEEVVEEIEPVEQSATISSSTEEIQIQDDIQNVETSTSTENLEQSSFDNVIEEPVLLPTQSDSTEEMIKTESKDKKILGKQEKARLIYEKTKRKSHDRDKYKIDIVDMNEVEDGVAVFARVWDRGEQIGFGQDGTVDIERFIFKNPPISVPDKSVTYTYELDGETFSAYGFKEDPEEALLQSLEHVIEAKKLKFNDEKIKQGKVGNTTTTFYPSAGQSSPVDGGLIQWFAGGTSWSSIRNDTTSSWVHDDIDGVGAFNTAQIYDGYNGAWNGMSRGVFGFDTSSLGSDTIDAVTLSIHGSAKTDGYSGADVVVDRVVPASNSSLAVGDFDLTNWDETLQSDTRITISAWDNTDYNDFVLNSIGEGNINSSGISWYGVRHGMDFDDAEPTRISTNSRIITRYADANGTSEDPKLIVEHTGSAAGSSGSGIQSLEYEYDSVGNITKITDTSSTTLLGEVDYIYDDLYRLASASTTNSATSSYLRNFTYNSIGNILTKTGGGTYVYAGDTGTNYANPHAATSIGGVSVSYDDNGNVTAFGSDSYTWNYRNELIESDVNGATTTYAYDHNGDRVSKSSDGNTTYYVSSMYEVEDSDITKHVYLGDMLVATIESDGSADEIHHNHLDHLNSTNVVTNASGTVDQLLSYYPFGSMRVDQKLGTVDQSKRHTGHDYDEETDLNYMGARYYAGDTGRFTSQDPVSLALGDWKTVQDKTGGNLAFYLQNPQTHNSYSYTANNPLKYVDKNGEFIWFAPAVIYAPQILAGLAALSTPLGVAMLVDDYQTLTNNPDGLDLALIAVPGVLGKAGDVAKVSMNRNAWSAGRAGNAQNSLTNHFKDHGELLGAKSAQEYYDRANDAMKPGSGFTRLENADGKVDYYNPSNRELVGLNEKGQISTYHKVTNTNKAEGLDYRVKKKQNEKNGGG